MIHNGAVRPARPQPSLQLSRKCAAKDFAGTHHHAERGGDMPRADRLGWDGAHEHRKHAIEGPTKEEDAANPQAEPV